MLQTLNNQTTLKQTLASASYRGTHSFFAKEGNASWDALSTGSLVGERDLRGKSVLIAVTLQFTTAALLLELDGVARRVLLYPADLTLAHLSYVARTAAVDVVLSDRDMGAFERPDTQWIVPLDGLQAVSSAHLETIMETEWVLLTSGTTGRPKLVVHTFASLIEATKEDPSPEEGSVWGTFYDIRRYGGLQIFLRAALAGSSLVVSSPDESVSDFMVRASSRGVTHISGTPTHWRRAAMSGSANLISPRYVRLSGEIADQGILSHLASIYPKAAIAHAFATTEAGVVFTVNDGLAGVPLTCLSKSPLVETKFEDGSLRIRSTRTALCYLGEEAPVLQDANGFVDTGDVLERRQERYYFAGRGDGVINVGGKKVYPEEVEAVINGHPQVRMSLVRTKKSSIVGSVVVADIVLKAPASSSLIESGDLHREILNFCRSALDGYKVPAAVNFVPALPIADSGKLVRSHA